MKENYNIPVGTSFKVKGFIKYLIVVLLGMQPIMVKAYAQNDKLNLALENATLHVVMNEIRNQSAFDFMYNAADIRDDFRVSVALKDADIHTVLKACFDKMGIDYLIRDNIIILQKRKDIIGMPQMKIWEIKGIVQDSKGASLPGVSVRLQGTTLGVSTDVDGRFLIKVPQSDSVALIFSFIGMKLHVVKVKDAREIKVVMQDEVSTLDEVVVTGMEVVKKERMTGSAVVLTAKDLRAQGVSSLDRILEGQIAGLNSTTVSGAPGTRARISIRGENNLSGNTEPLWIVDGLPLMSGVPKSSSGDYAGTIMQDGVGNIMPEDIETITILKDASASAIYGAKAANGVIVITTKKGFHSKTQFNYSGSYNCAIAPAIDLNFMNSAEKLLYETNVVDAFGLDYGTRAGRGGYLYKRRAQGYITGNQYTEELNKLRGINTDWFKVLFRPAQSHSHNLSMRGGGEEMSYYASVNFQQSEGILRSNNYSNAGVLIKLDYQPLKNLSVGLGISANLRKSSDNASAVDPFTYAVFANPYERPYDEKGNYASDLSYLGNNYTEETTSGYKYDTFNILHEMEQTKKSQDGLDSYLTFNLKYEFLKGLSFETIIRKGISYNTETTELNAGTYSSYAKEVFAKKVYKNQDVLPNEYNNGELSEASGKNFNWSIRNQIDYAFNLKEDHSFSILVASEITSKKYNNFGYTSPVYYADYRITGVPSFTDDVAYKTLQGEVGNMFYTTDGQDKTVSFLGSMRYSFRDKYVINFNYRADGADVIGKTNRFTPLWSVGLRYNLHNENFFRNDIVNELSFRGSFGYTGNIDRTAYPFSTMKPGENSYLGDRYVTEFTYPNPSVGWEKKLDRNLGLDVSFLKSRINFTVDYYSNRTENILESLIVPVSTGREQVKANGGIVQNSGIEVYMNLKWVNRSDISFSTSFNVSRNKNVIKRSLYDKASYAEVIKTQQFQGGIVNIIGQETGSVYGWDVAGVDPRTGNPMFYLTEEGKKDYMKIMDQWYSMTPEYRLPYVDNITSFESVPDYVGFTKDQGITPAYMMSSMQYLGSSNPKFVGGFNTNLRYKNFEFTTSWAYKLGHIIPTFMDYRNAPNSGSYGSSDLAVSGTNRQKKYLSFWQSPGDVTNVSRFVAGGNDYWAGQTTSQDYEKGDFLRMTNLSLSYRLDSDIASRLGMSSMMLTFNVRNLLTFTKYRGLDPETGGAFSYPTAREFNVKLSVGF